MYLETFFFLCSYGMLGGAGIYNVLYKEKVHNYFIREGH